MGAAEHQLLPLEVESLNCGGNARCSAELVKKLELKPRKIIMVQVCVLEHVSSTCLTCEVKEARKPEGVFDV